MRNRGNMRNPKIGRHNARQGKHNETMQYEKKLQIMKNMKNIKIGKHDAK